MAFEVTILGSNSAIPAHGRHPTSQVLHVRDYLFLLDCGEGTQIQLEKYKIRHGKIEHIFISHLHGDHFFGLIGLLTSYHLNHREKPLTVFCPKGLDEIINVQLKYSDTHLRYPLHFEFYEPQNGNRIFENDTLAVETVKLVHRIPCAGFVFREKVAAGKNIKPEAITHYNLSIQQIQAIKKGSDLSLANGSVVKNEELTLKPHHPRAYAYCTDTAFEESIIPTIQGVDLLYHEATFDKSNAQRARETFHSTTEQAALIAQKAQVKKLLIGHFSARYRTLEELLKETRKDFSNTELALEGSKFEIPRE